MNDITASKSLIRRDGVTLLSPNLLGALIKYQWRSLRTVTFWIARVTPDYYRRTFALPGYHPMGHGVPEWRQEQEYWREELKKFWGISHVPAIYPASYWIHATVALDSQFLNQRKENFPGQRWGKRYRDPTPVVLHPDPPPQFVEAWAYPEIGTECEGCERMREDGSCGGCTALKEKTDGSDS